MADETDAHDQVLEGYRGYLRYLASQQLDARLQGKLDASDLVQQSLFEAHQAWTRIRGKSPAELAAYLRRVLANNLTDAVRRFGGAARNVDLEQAIDASAARLDGLLSSGQPSPSQHAVRAERVLQLQRALGELPDEQRRAVELKHLQGLAVAEVARLMGKSETAVGGLLVRGLRKLRQLLDE